jgi:hypothetical protein
VLELASKIGKMGQPWLAWLPEKGLDSLPEPVFLNDYGAQESILKNEFRQPM